uniref:transcription initiation factor TFIID subunit 8-like n=1 Tax=Erigeron canadensis TaxID=72917 RepID=UPI001CB9889B|nr:transcription initiation factor TFIID subunit 8-like [Erigeron canadensis]
MKKNRTRTLSSQSKLNIFQSSDFHTAVSKIAVTQICKSVGYAAAQTTALQTLTNIAVSYLQSIAKSAVISAVSTGRTQCNLYDVIRGLEDLHYDVGFTGNGNINKRLYPLADSSMLLDIRKFVYRNREIPFAKPLPRGCDVDSQCLFGDSEKVLKHVPRWLPDFPVISEKEEKTVVAVVVAGGSDLENEGKKAASELAAKRERISFKIVRRSGSKTKNEIKLEFGVCKGGKRISCHNYTDNDDENFFNHYDELASAAACSNSTMIIF